MGADSLRAKIRDVVAEHERFWSDVRATAAAVSSENKRSQAHGQAELLKFALGDFVSYARVRPQGVIAKLISIWTGPWRVVADHVHVYSVQKIVSGKVHQAHVARLRSYGDETFVRDRRSEGCISRLFCTKLIPNECCGPCRRR
ncbi:unnamed protein product [Hapterophycus canaliculatus]